MKTRKILHKSRFPSISRKGIGTLEVVIIIAVLLSVALIFRQSLTTYAKNLIKTVFNEQNVIDDLENDQASK